MDKSARRHEARVRSTIRLAKALGVRARFDTWDDYRTPTEADLVDPVYVEKFRRMMRAGFCDLGEMRASMYIGGAF